MTNTTKESKDLLVKRLKRLRLDVHDSQIFTSLSAAKHYVTENKLKPHLMLHDDALSEFSEIQTNGKPDAILIGLAPDKFDYSSLNQAFRYYDFCSHATSVQILQDCDINYCESKPCH